MQRCPLDGSEMPGCLQVAFMRTEEDLSQASKAVDEVLSILWLIWIALAVKAAGHIAFISEHETRHCWVPYVATCPCVYLARNFDGQGESWRTPKVFKPRVRNVESDRGGVHNDQMSEMPAALGHPRGIAVGTSAIVHSREFQVRCSPKRSIV